MSLDSGRSPDSAEDAEEGGTAAGPAAPGDTGYPAEPDADADEPSTPDPPPAHDATGASDTSEAPAAAETETPPEADMSEAPAEPDAGPVPSAASVAGAGQEPGGASESSVPGASGLPGDTAVDLDSPLLADVAGLRTSWQRIQAGFVDDPREAVSDAANLVDHTAQTLVGALQQRQRLLRARWDRGRTLAGFGGSEDDADTEELRLLIQRYRIVFDHICRP